MSHTEVFTEAEWEDARLARQKRDLRLAQLQSQGYVCTAENCQTILDGRWVYLVVATPQAVADDPNVEPSSRSSSPDRSRPQRKPSRKSNPEMR